LIDLQKILNPSFSGGS